MLSTAKREWHSFVSRQQQHEHISIEDYFKKTVVIPFLDHLISDILSRFTAHAKQAATIKQLQPTNITSDTTCMSIKEAVEFYSDDLPNPDILDEKLPLSSCACESSASVLRRLNTYLRCTQTEQRLSALALIHMHEL